MYRTNHTEFDSFNFDKSAVTPQLPEFGISQAETVISKAEYEALLHRNETTGQTRSMLEIAGTWQTLIGRSSLNGKAEAYGSDAPSSPLRRRYGNESAVVFVDKPDLTSALGQPVGQKSRLHTDGLVVESLATDLIPITEILEDGALSEAERRQKIVEFAGECTTQVAIDYWQTVVDLTLGQRELGA